MYNPPAFSENNRETLFDFIDQNSFGVLVSQHDGAPFATHLPFLTDRQSGEHGHLIAHFARANPQWTQAEGQKVLAIFSGPHAYISPTWYAVPNAVPTWNYTAVHVNGIFETISDPGVVMQVLNQTVTQFEDALEVPWTFDTSNDFYSKLAQQIVAFRIRITSIEGKWKLNQNRPVEQQERVARALERSNDASERGVAALMRAKLDGLKARPT